MIRHLLLILLVSFITVMWMPHIAGVFHSMAVLYEHVIGFIDINIGGYQVGVVPRRIFGLVVIPTVFALVVRLAYVLMRKQASVAVPVVLWAIWLVLTTALICKVG